MMRPTLRSLRLASGLTLFFYVATHLANHSAGLVSLSAAESARLWFTGFWRSALPTLALYGALLLHLGLAVVALLERRSWHLPAIEAVRLTLGFMVPLLLFWHIVATRIAHTLYGVDDTYARLVAGMWAQDGGLRQMALMCIAWGHGCIGVHLVYRHRPCYRQAFHLMFAAMLLLPALAALGFLAMARELGHATSLVQAAPGDEQRAMLMRIGSGLLAAYGVLLLGTLAWWRRPRAWRGGARGRELRYPDRTVTVPQGWSVLEASRAHGIAHLSLCGGRARCSTCRVRVEGPPRHCPAPGLDEARTLSRIGAAPDVRLACQLRPTGNLRVTPQLEARGALPRGHGNDGNVPAHGERELAILFVDLRQWTDLSERHLPFDLMHVLDRYFAEVGAAVGEAGGVPNQFIGDSVMALFGLDVDLRQACRQAVDAARRIERRLDALNDEIEAALGHRFDFGIGIHAGRVAVGEVGYRETRSLSAVGDVVNTASRLQELTKALAARVVVSAEVAQQAGLALSGAPARQIVLRGRREPLTAYALPEGA